MNSLQPSFSPAESPTVAIGDHAPLPADPGTEADVMRSWQSIGPPLASVLCPTYNHKHFIRHALDGVLAQRTTFPFELIVRDDGSTDGTADIVREYADRFPSIVRAQLEPQNTFSRGVSARAAMMPLVRGEYVALCDGDDYWIDRNKLQRQINLLEDTPSISLLTTAFYESRDGIVNKISDHSGSCGDATPRHRKPSTWVFRSDHVDLPHDIADRHMMGDLFILSQLELTGHVRLLGDLMGTVVNQHSTSMFAGAGDRSSNFRAFNLINGWLWIGEYHRRRRHHRMYRRQVKHAASAWHAFLQSIGPAHAALFCRYLLAVHIKRRVQSMLGIKHRD